MTVEEIRKERAIIAIITARSDMSLPFFGKELLCALLEIAAQLAELNELLRSGNGAIEVRNVSE